MRAKAFTIIKKSFYYTPLIKLSWKYFILENLKSTAWNSRLYKHRGFIV
jgi:hypothetical protein